jgi:hypothetical protein
MTGKALLPAILFRFSSRARELDDEKREEQEEATAAFTSATCPAIAKTATLCLCPDLLPRPGSNTRNGLAWKQIKAY